MSSKFLTICAIFCSLILTTTTSCSSDDDGGSGGGDPAANGVLKATIDGAGFESTPITSSLTIIETQSGKSFFITATDLQGRNITLQIALGYEGEGNYEIGGENLAFVNASWIVVDISNPLNSETYVAPYDDTSVRGEMQISSDDGSNVQGTFNFTAKLQSGSSVVNVTNGSFNLDY